MNHYGKWWDDTITLYNKVTDRDGKVTWYRHLLEECFYKHTVEKVTTGDTTLTSDSSICRIKVSDKFITKREYDMLDDSAKEVLFTLAAGDIIVPEEVDFEIDEYTRGKRSSDLIQEYKEYPGCFTIEIVDVKVSGGRGNEHYKVKGM